MFNDLSSPLSLLETRRSGKAREMTTPGPDARQLRSILEIATRTPDHGKLAPWRFIIIPDEHRKTLENVLKRAFLADKPEATIAETNAMCGFISDAPTLVVLLSSPKRESTIPLWEQELSVGAAAMNLLHAAHALGFVGSWITAWPAFHNEVRNVFGNENQRIAGFMFIGTPKGELQERPRPKYEDVVSIWQGEA
ncbi:MAG: nitroreductase [Sphingobium sp.]|nr:nitroreductase [Sphingobium sp.]